MEKEDKKKLIGAILLATAICLPAILLIIFQTTQGIINVPNIVVLVIIAIIIRSAVHVYMPNKAKKEIEQRVQQKAGVDEKYKIANANTNSIDSNTNSNATSMKSKIISKALCLVFALLCTGLAVLSYSKMVNKYKDSSYKFYDAEVVSVVDKTTYETIYDEEDGYTVTEHDKCEVTFKYFDGESYKTVKKIFNNTKVVPTDSMKIYIKDGRVGATEYTVLGGKVLVGWLLMLGAICIIMFLLDTDLILASVSIIFIASGTIFVMPLSIYPLAMLYVEYGSIVALLSSVGFFSFGYSVYLKIKERKE